ncbi:hypothetical protein COO60DRAFT_705381 [Scenedesmus sp. NREL 46B-D3]|nr:hypothetical protein COO60DRAFT_705381 [Scenedesmus sp. NREL 46B-D3]
MSHSPLSHHHSTPPACSALPQQHMPHCPPCHLVEAPAGAVLHEGLVQLGTRDGVGRAPAFTLLVTPTCLLSFSAPFFTCLLVLLREGVLMEGVLKEGPLPLRRHRAHRGCGQPRQPGVRGQSTDTLAAEQALGLALGIVSGTGHLVADVRASGLALAFFTASADE